MHAETLQEKAHVKITIMHKTRLVILTLLIDGSILGIGNKEIIKPSLEDTAINKGSTLVLLDKIKHNSDIEVPVIIIERNPFATKDNRLQRFRKSRELAHLLLHIVKQGIMLLQEMVHRRQYTFPVPSKTTLIHDLTDAAHQEWITRSIVINHLTYEMFIETNMMVCLIFCQHPCDAIGR